MKRLSSIRFKSLCIVFAFLLSCNMAFANDEIINIPNNVILVQAENSILSGGAKSGNSNLNYSGSGYVEELNGNAKIIVRFESIISEEVVMRIVYANANKDKSYMNMKVNDDDTKMIGFLPVRVSDWNKWGSSYEKINLKKGINIIELFVKDGYPCNIKMDCILFSRDKSSLEKAVVAVDKSIDINKYLFEEEIKFEAEDAVLTGVSFSNEHKGFSGAGFVSDIGSVGENINFKLDIKEGGEKIIKMSYGNAFADARTLSLYVNGKKVKQVKFVPVIVGNWAAFNSIYERINLVTGKNEVTFKVDDGDNGIFNFDYIAIGTLKDFPIGKGEGYQEKFDGYEIMEAEGSIIKGMTVVSPYATGCSGTGYLTYMDWLYSSSSYEYESDKTKDYVLKIGYGNATSSHRTLSLSINKNKIEQLVFPILEKGNWKKWGTVTRIVTLQEGVNEIKLFNDYTDTGGMNIDFISLSSDKDIIEKEKKLLDKEPAITQLHPFETYKIPLPVVDTSVTISNNIMQVTKGGITEQKDLVDSTFVSEKGVTYIPLRDTFTALGAKVLWENWYNQARVNFEGLTVALPVNKSEFYANSFKYDIDNIIVQKDGVTFVPLNVFEVLGYNVFNENNTVILNNK